MTLTCKAVLSSLMSRQWMRIPTNDMVCSSYIFSPPTGHPTGDTNVAPRLSDRCYRTAAQATIKGDALLRMRINWNISQIVREFLTNCCWLRQQGLIGPISCDVNCWCIIINFVDVVMYLESPAPASLVAEAARPPRSRVSAPTPLDLYKPKVTQRSRSLE